MRSRRDCPVEGPALSRDKKGSTVGFRTHASATSTRRQSKRHLCWEEITVATVLLEISPYSKDM